MATLITKNSSTASAVPSVGDLVKGELAVNVTDKKLFTKDNSGAVVKVVGSLGNQESNAVVITGGTINGTSIGATTPSSGAFTTASASSGFTGNLTGNVTGNVSGTAANVTGVVAVANGGTGLTALGTGVQTAFGQAVTGSGGFVLANSPTLVTPNLGTPSAVTLTNATGLPISTGVSGMAAGAATFLFTPSSANLAALVTDETGTGALVFANSPTLVTPNLGTPSALVGTNITGTATNFNINGTVGATTPASGAFTTVAASGAVTLSGGAANGVAYLNGSKVLTTGSALTFDGTTLATTGRTSSANGAWVASGAVMGWGAAGTFSNYIVGDTTLNYLLFQVNSAEQMRLTSTGLGIGTSSPAQKLVVSNAGAQGFEFDPVTGIMQVFNRATSAYGELRPYGALIRFFTGSSPVETMRLDSSGNLGLGVTPSAWKSTYRAYDVGTAALGSTTGVSISLQTANAYLNASDQYIYKITDAASSYRQLQGAHAWFTAPSGTAGNPISFSQVMTLDASGNLLVGGTSVYAATMTSYASASRSAGLGLRNSAGTTAGGIFTAAAGSGGGSTDVLVEAAGYLGFNAGGATERARITSAGDFIQTANTTAPTLSTNGTVGIQRVSDTQLKILMRGSDGVTRSVTLTLA